jgi:hypothetical protein
VVRVPHLFVGREGEKKEGKRYEEKEEGRLSQCEIEIIFSV